MKYEIRCKDCGYIWKGKTLLEAEQKADANPCKCSALASKMSDEELLKKIGEY